MFTFFKKSRITLEQQLETLKALGFELNAGIGKDDLLYSFTREEYENEPYALLFIVLGFEVEKKPWGRKFCSRVWNFDYECIDSHGSYVDIVNNLCRVAQVPDLVTDLKDYVDLETEKAWLKYSIDQTERHIDIKVDNDWADHAAVVKVTADIERNEKVFYAMDNGQSAVLFYLSTDEKNAINEISSNKLVRFS